MIPKKKTIPVLLPNNMQAMLQFTQNQNGEWICLMAEQTMMDIQALLSGKPLPRELVKPWTGDILL